jgi:hypothetical protein
MGMGSPEAHMGNVPPSQEVTNYSGDGPEPEIAALNEMYDSPPAPGHDQQDIVPGVQPRVFGAGVYASAAARGEDKPFTGNSLVGRMEADPQRVTTTRAIGMAALPDLHADQQLTSLVYRGLTSDAAATAAYAAWQHSRTPIGSNNQRKKRKKGDNQSEWALAA